MHVFPASTRAGGAAVRAWPPKVSQGQRSSVHRSRLSTGTLMGDRIGNGGPPNARQLGLDELSADAPRLASTDGRFRHGTCRTRRSQGPTASSRSDLHALEDALHQRHQLWVGWRGLKNARRGHGQSRVATVADAGRARRCSTRRDDRSPSRGTNQPEFWSLRPQRNNARTACACRSRTRPKGRPWMGVAVLRPLRSGLPGTR